MKDLGDETESAGGDSGGSAGDTSTLGGECEPGEEMPAPDGCNTCVCAEEGIWSCTGIGCDPTLPPGTDDGPPPGMCTPDEVWDDGCNTCTCQADGEGWDCSAIYCGSTDGEACTPGEEMPAGDGCNTCTCTDGGEWACTDAACPGQVEICDALDPDHAAITAASIRGDDLLVSLSYGGGCEQHTFMPCWSGAFEESLPVQVGLALSHSGPPDPCEAVVEEDLSFSLLPMRDAYEDGYGTTSGTIVVHLAGWAGSLTYSW